MNPFTDPIADWMACLARRGARFAAGDALHFGDPAREQATLRTSATAHPLVDAALICASGADAAAFLQSQLSNDVALLDQPRAQLSTYCTAQGRMLATLLLWRNGDAFLLQLPTALADGVRARLQKYILRAKVALQDVSRQYASIGLGGAGAEAVVNRALGVVPAERMALVHTDTATCIRLTDTLFQITVPAQHAAQLWDQLSVWAEPVGTEGWSWRLIQAGIPTITAATQEQFVPQMANLEQLGAISFQKGCYPGQEIVARAQYRGEVKRRLHQLHAAADAARPGQEVFRASGGACGTVVNAAPAPGGGVDLLAVVLTSAADEGDLRLGGADGPALSRWP